MRRKNETESGLGCVAAMILGVLFMPIVGLVFVCGKDPGRKTLGWVLLVGGIILWLLLM